MKKISDIPKLDRPLASKHFEEFEKCYGKDPNGQSKRQDLASEAITELEAVVDDLKEVLQLIETNGENGNG